MTNTFYSKSIYWFAKKGMLSPKKVYIGWRRWKLILKTVTLFTGDGGIIINNTSTWSEEWDCLNPAQASRFKIFVFIYGNSVKCLISLGTPSNSTCDIIVHLTFY